MHLVWRGEIKFFVFFLNFFFHACKHSISPGRKVVRDRRLIVKTGLDPKEIKSALVFPVMRSDFACTNPLIERRILSPIAFPKGAFPRWSRYDLQGKSPFPPPEDPGTAHQHSQQTLLLQSILVCEFLPGT